jgi:fructose-1,6-bisphosphatase-3
MEMRSLELLSKEYPNIQAATAEVINLNAIKCLPKGTEYFFSDLHGEYEGFLHLLRSASGVIRTKIEDLFGRSISTEDRDFLAELIYAPEKMIRENGFIGKEGEEWQKIIIYRLIQVCKKSSTKYTRSKVRKKMPKEYAYILDELLHADNDIDKEYYYQAIISSITDMGNGDSFIIAICKLIQDLCIDRLHIIGDIYDRGPRPDIIISELGRFHDVDIQWGNHDISWMGAACGNTALIANVIRMAIRYNNFDLIEDGYGISLRALSTFASEVYGHDDCKHFIPNVWDENKFAPVTLEMAAKMHKAITIIQFKLEGQLIKKHPEYYMDDRACLLKIDYKKGVYCHEGKEYPLKDTSFPTIDEAKPLLLTGEEEKLLNIMKTAFEHSKELRQQIQYLYTHGSMYKCVNKNLLYHGCIPMTEEGEFDTIEMNGKVHQGKELMDWMNELVNRAYLTREQGARKQRAVDFMWYLWCGSKSPVFGKNKMATFESYFLEEKELKKEEYNPYYELSQREDICDKILEEFGMGGVHSHIINGHVPVKIKDGESPIKGNGKLFVIDGGISKAYQSKTGIAGYTLIYNSRTLNLAEHKPLSEHNQTPTVRIIEVMNPRVSVEDTDIGKELTKQANELMELIAAYQSGKLIEKI